MTDDKDKCLLCSNPLNYVGRGDRSLGPSLFCECNACGRFVLTERVLLWLRNPVFDPAIISAYTSHHSDDAQPMVILSEEPSTKLDFPWTTLERIQQWFPSDVSLRLDKILHLLAKRSKFPGDRVEISAQDYPLFYVDSKKHALDIMSFLLQTLIDSEYIQGKTTFPSSFVVTAKGWNHIMENKGESKQVFIAMWFNDQMDDACENGLKKAIRDAGYVPLKINDKEHNGKIDDQIIAELRRSHFVVCDFTGQRGGVYFEAGFAMGLGLPVIWACHKDDVDNLHFDTRQYNHIVWSTADDLYTKLLHRIQATI